jgi:hypothetical protein
MVAVLIPAAEVAIVSEMTLAPGCNESAQVDIETLRCTDESFS